VLGAAAHGALVEALELHVVPAPHMQGNSRQCALERWDMLWRCMRGVSGAEYRHLCLRQHSTWPCCPLRLTPAADESLPRGMGVKSTQSRRTGHVARESSPVGAAPPNLDARAVGIPEAHTQSSRQCEERTSLIVGGRALCGPWRDTV
jgi:hypothetical protein